MGTAGRADPQPAPRQARGTTGRALPAPTHGRHPGHREPAPWASRFLGALAALLAVAAPPASADPPAVRFDGGRLILGRTPSAVLTIAIDEEERWRPLRIAVSAGSVSEPEQVCPGIWEATYTPPATRFPQLVTAALWREGLGQEVAVVRFPLHGATRLPVKADPGAEVAVEVAGERFGPVAAGADGLAPVPIVVPPGAREARVLVRRGDEGAERRVKLDAPAASRSLAVALLPPDGAPASVLPRLVLVQDGGPRLDPAKVRVVASAGAVALEPAAPLARGARPGRSKEAGEPQLVAWRWTAPRPAPAAVTFDLFVEGAAQPRASAALTLAPPPPVPLPPPPVASLPQTASPPAEAARSPIWIAGRAGYASAGEGASGPRAGVELWADVLPGRLPLGAGLLATAGLGRRSTSAGTADVVLVPVSIRAGWDLRLHGALRGRAGAALTGAFASGSGPSGSGSGLGAGAGLFGSVTWLGGPVDLFAEISLGRVPVETPAGRFDAGGLALDVGARLAVH